ncbi:MAG: sugar phosphate isomerase/epimerase [Candidatus Hydrogenedentes bacterium]|nr:sugar phosphate isomerase/epimerase [Candidatus Hydrogenedentota bacterium]
MRLGGPVFEGLDDPAAWVRALNESGYTAAYLHVDPDAGDGVVTAYAEAARQAGIVIAEVGAWSNPLSRDDATRRAAMANCERRLAMADRAGARCCVNIAGSRGEKWDGPCPDDLRDETFDLIVATVREIIDAVKPTRTYYTLETMPWMYPDSADAYLRLIKAIDRDRFAVHLDPVNLVCSPQRYFANGALIRECFAKLGGRIRSCHGKDVILQQGLLTHLDEVRPGLGMLDYAVFIEELDRLSPDIPLMLEHLSSPEEYRLAADYVRSVAREVGIPC